MTYALLVMFVYLLKIYPYQKIEKEHGCILGGLSIYIVLDSKERMGGHDGGFS